MRKETNLQTKEYLFPKLEIYEFTFGKDILTLSTGWDDAIDWGDPDFGDDIFGG